MGVVNEIKREEVIRDLSESGADKEMVETVISLFDNNRIVDLIPILKRHKQRLLAKMYESQNAVDRFDFLVYRMEQLSKKKTGGGR